MLISSLAFTYSKSFRRTRPRNDLGYKRPHRERCRQYRGSVISMLDAVRVMRSLDVSWGDIAQMASSNPARLLGLDHECGSIEIGKRADLVALGVDGRICLTLVAGNVAFRN